MQQYQYWALTWAGIAYHWENQDAILLDGKIHQKHPDIQTGSFAVDGLRRVAISDGAAGHPKAAKASRCLLELLVELDARQPDLPPSARAARLQDAASDYVLAAPNMRDACATLVTVEWTAERTTLWHVGDSLGYRVTPNGVEALIAPHTAVNRMLAEGELSPAQSERLAGTTFFDGPDQMYMFSGLAEAPSIQAHTVDLGADEYLLLASDGLTEDLEKEDIAHLVNSRMNGQAIIQRLRKAVEAQDAHDNLSLIVVARLQS
jgi:protein phosphatase